MSLVFSVLLLSATAEPSVFECVDTPQYDCKTGVYSGPPEQNLFAQDREALTTIYRDYWTCHWQHLSRHADFGTSVGSAAIAALEQSQTACKMQGLAADRGMDALLAKQARYGDEKNRERLREENRGMGGVLFAYRSAASPEQRAKLMKTLEAATAQITENNNAQN
ncbi:hypothetical protein WBQ88_14575 [Sphingopyxis sp. CCNWLW253]|uniref:hypothetical protein n=1 Tax=unclassified Sphingopyxis TaxID=2614943 RepID=UPI003012F7DA